MTVSLTVKVTTAVLKSEGTVPEASDLLRMFEIVWRVSTLTHQRYIQVVQKFQH